MSEDEVGFARFYEASRHSCVRAVLASVGDQCLAEDLVAEAFARAWASWGKVKDHPAPKAWVLRTALNLRVSWWRRQRHELPLSEHDREPAPGPAATRLAAFSVVAQPDGTSALTLRKGQQYRLDPVALRQALAEHNIRALVTVGQSCDSAPEPEGLDQVVVSQRQSNGSVTLTINTGAMPAGSELSIGYYPTRTTFGLIQQDGPLHCRPAS